MKRHPVPVLSPRRAYTQAELEARERRLDALMAELHRDDAVGRRLAEAWLVRRTYAEEAEPSCMEVCCDGWSVFIEGDCIATWQPGPRRLYDSDVALLSDRRLRTGGFEIRARWGFTHVLDERSVPIVRVVPPYPCPYDYEPKQLVDGWEASQAVVHLLETRAHEPAIHDLVWAWTRDDEDARYDVYGHRCYIYDRSVICDEACLLTWGPSSRRVALLSARRYQLRTFQRLVRDALRVALRRHPLLVAEVKPPCPHRYVQAGDLLLAWELEKLCCL